MLLISIWLKTVLQDLRGKNISIVYFMFIFNFETCGLDCTTHTHFFEKVCSSLDFFLQRPCLYLAKILKVYGIKNAELFPSHYLLSLNSPTFHLTRFFPPRICQLFKTNLIKAVVFSYNSKGFFLYKKCHFSFNLVFKGYS